MGGAEAHATSPPPAARPPTRSPDGSLLGARADERDRPLHGEADADRRGDRGSPAGGPDRPVAAEVRPRPGRLEPQRQPQAPEGNGNFVVSEFTVTAAPKAAAREAPPVPTLPDVALGRHRGLRTAELPGRPPPSTATPPPAGRSTTAPATSTSTAPPPSAPRAPSGFDAGATLTFRLDQNYPDHTLGRFRLSVGPNPPRPRRIGRRIRRPAPRPLPRRATGRVGEVGRPEVRHWTVLDPQDLQPQHDGTITKLPDGSLLYTGDNPYRDLYKI